MSSASRTPPHAKNKQELRDNMNEWVDADEVASAAAFDLATDLPKLYASCWSMKKKLGSGGVF